MNTDEELMAALEVEYKYSNEEKKSVSIIKGDLSYSIM